jgi:putative flippase GtrA
VTRVARFGLAGGVGFALDFLVLLAMLQLGFGPWLGRAVSFAAAVVATYLLNARFTFSAADSIGPRSFVLYLAASLGGLALNVAIYAALVVAGLSPALALVCASAAAMVFNYASYSRIF